ncbi:hypothetical protein EYF80_052915 [Liparis tanakae]|uniref:Uncharacterized protein n=1 Tax=Liparis tanakae TaxID=230148 RepID=A0A4Z2F6Y8_9TELE|nr:hypothetical protein EYF80_052915 [Liparis tanakae]
MLGINLLRQQHSSGRGEDQNLDSEGLGSAVVFLPAPPLCAPGAAGAVSGAPRLASPRIFLRLDPTPLFRLAAHRDERTGKEQRRAPGEGRWKRGEKVRAAADTYGRKSDISLSPFLPEGHRHFPIPSCRATKLDTRLNCITFAI